MKQIMAKQGERLDTIYFREYGENAPMGDYKNGYHAFCLANFEHLDIWEFSGGELVNLPEFETPTITNEAGGLWE